MDRRKQQQNSNSENHQLNGPQTDLDFPSLSNQPRPATNGLSKMAKISDRLARVANWVRWAEMTSHRPGITDTINRQKKVNEHQSAKGNVVRKFVFLGVLSLSLTITGDTMRIAAETYAFSYDNGYPEVNISRFGQLFVLSIASCLSVIGTLGLMLAFSLAAQVAHVSRVLLQSNIALARTMTVDEARLVRMLLPDGH